MTSKQPFTDANFKIPYLGGGHLWKGLNPSYCSFDSIYKVWGPLV